MKGVASGFIECMSFKKKHIGLLGKLDIILLGLPGVAHRAKTGFWAENISLFNKNEDMCLTQSLN